MACPSSPWLHFMHNMESPSHWLSLNAWLSLYLSQNNGIITLSIQSLVEQLYLLMTENYKKGKKRYFFGQNWIFESVVTCINVAISQKYNKLTQVRTAENCNRFHDWPKTQGIRSGVPVLPALPYIRYLWACSIQYTVNLWLLDGTSCHYSGKVCHLVFSITWFKGASPWQWPFPPSSEPRENHILLLLHLTHLIL